MLFNSYVFILIFLPITWVVYHVMNQQRQFTFAKCWLVIASLFFVSYWSYKPLPILILSILVNFGLSIWMQQVERKRPILWLGMIFNVGILCYFKYANFFYESWSMPALKVALPLGISYYTIQQIAFLIDTYEGVSEERNMLDYILYVTFFPKFIAGPIAPHGELLPQFKSYENKIFSPRNIQLGIYIFCIGLFKKVIIADTFSSWSAAGFGQSEKLHFFSAWGTSLAYTFQLYFDFSGYSDMAVGAAKLFNIQLPQNFNSPLTAKNINDFWGRWHMTLTAFIRTYVFTPLVRIMPNTTFGWSMLAMFLAMVIVGLWHGNTWTFGIYGAFHGLGIVIHHNWKKKKKKMSPWLGWFITFNFVNISFVLFRAKDLQEAANVYRGMLGLQGWHVPKMGIKLLAKLKEYGAVMGPYMTNEDNLQLMAIVGGFILIFKGRNTLELENNFEPQTKRTLAISLMFVLCLFGMNRVSEFIYFNF